MSTLTNWCVFFVLNSAWQLLVVITLGTLLTRLLPKLSNGLQYSLWVSCLLFGVSLPVISTYLAVIPVKTAGAMTRQNETDRWKTPRPPDHGRLTSPLTGVQSTHLNWSPFRVVAGFYIASLLIGVTLLLLRLEKTRRIVRQRMPIAPALRGIIDLQSNMRGIDTFLSRDVDGPATVSWPKPMILLPAAFDRMEGKELAAVMAHEVAHVRRDDFLKNLIFEAISLPLCYHPAIPCLKKRIAECREAICDDVAAESTSGREAYALALLNVAQMTALPGRVRTELALGIATTDLERRIMKLVQVPSPMSFRRKFFLQALCISTLAVVSVGALSFSLHPTSVQAAGMPAFPFDPSQTFDTPIPPGQRKPAPNFTLVDNNGKTITLSDYKGKVVLLDFWATWCGGCKLEIPWYMEFDRKYRKDGLAVIGVSMDEKGWEAVRPFLAKKNEMTRLAA